MRTRILAGTLFIFLTVSDVWAQPLGTAFTYQGRLKNGGSPANGSFNMDFRLYPVPAGGTLLASQTLPGVSVTDGLFTVQVDFGAGVFDGNQRWLDVTVNGTPLVPRQALTGAPNALFAARPWRTTANDVFYDAGNVGIGTSVPAERLEVAGNAKVNGTVFTNAVSGNSPLVLRTNGLSRIYISETGNIGIGTDGPTTRLHVDGLVRSSGAGGGFAFPDGSSMASAATPGPPVSVNLIALLRWDLLLSGTTFPVGGNPFAVAFDGANIWVTNGGSTNVTKLRALDGTNLGTFPVGDAPRGMAFDGANMWVANLFSDNVTKLRASDGMNLGTFPLGGGQPFGVAFDGANIWVANNTLANVTKLRASDGANLGTFPVGMQPYAVAFDGASIWVTNALSDNVTKLRASDGANMGTFPVGDAPRGVAFDGANMWVTNQLASSVTKLRASDGANLGTFPFGTANPYGVAFDGANIWVANDAGGNGTVSRIFIR